MPLSPASHSLGGRLHVLGEMFGVGLSLDSVGWNGVTLSNTACGKDCRGAELFLRECSVASLSDFPGCTDILEHGWQQV